jgi:tRNA(Ile)-lysidine synthase
VDPLLKQRLQTFFESQALIGRDRQVHFLVAYSGGKDSTALLHSLVSLANEIPELDIHITAAYYWHPWRPLQEDLQVIHQNCKQLQVPWVVLTPNLNLPKTESAAREDRYIQLAKLANDLAATAVLTAHHQNDQVETILFRLFRGTGLDGITGIPTTRMIQLNPTTEICVARPFLNEQHATIEQYVATHQLCYVEDPTNSDLQIRRNFIRHEVLPRIETSFPHFQHALLTLAELTTGDLEIIETKINETWQDIYDPQAESLNEVPFSQLSMPFQRRIIRKFMEMNDLEAGFKKIDNIVAFINGKNRSLQKPALYSIAPNRFLSLYRNRISLETSEKSDILPVKVSVPAQVSHREMKATLSITPLTPEQRLKPIDYSKLRKNEVLVDLSRLQSQEITLRTRQTGDRIKPLGMKETIKLKRFFMNRYIPRFQRDKVPLLTQDSDVLWAVGIGLSEDICVKIHPTHMITFKEGG